MAISIWYISFLQHLLGLAPATLNTQGSPPSAQDLLHWVSLHFRQTRPRRSTRPIELWKSQFGSRSSRSNAHQNSLVSILFSLKTWEDIVYMVPLPCGYLREFRFLEGIRDARRAAAYMCQFTRSEYKRPIGILSNCTSLRPLLFLGWPNLVEVQNSLKYKGPLPLSCSCGREHTPLIGLTDDATFRTSSSVGFGADFWISCVYDDILERSFVSLRDGDRLDLTPLGDSPLLSPSLASASTSLRSTYEAWKAGTLTKASMVDIAPSDSIAAYFSAPPRSSLGSSSRSCLRSLWKVFPVSSTVVLPDGSTACTTSSTPTVSSLRARSRSPCRMKRPLVLLRPRGDVSSVVTGAPPGSLSARCVVFTVSPCLIIFPFFLSFNN